MTQTYFDFVAPCEAAGAVQNKKGEWHLPGKPNESYCASQFLREYGLAPLRVDPPKGRTFAAIRKAHTSYSTEPTPSSKDWQAMRAVQYMAAMRGEETGYRLDGNRPVGHVRFEQAPDGSRRVRSVHIKGEGWVDVPHWDFTPSIIDMSMSGAA